MRKRRKIFSRILAILLFAVVLVQNSFPMRAEENRQIQNNGEGGIYIDINAEPYTRLANVPGWGDYAYSEAGCAWYATARVSDLTGIDIPMIYGASRWYNSVYSRYGFEKGDTTLKRAKALACYKKGQDEHIAVVEKIEGSRVLISEGGNTKEAGAASGYTVLRWVDKEKMTATDDGKVLMGYIYFTIGGECGSGGSDLTWELSNEGILTIRGTGEMASWDIESSVPWYEYRDQIKKVVIDETVTSIGDRAFSECKALTEVMLGAGIREIGAYAFSHCESLPAVYLPDSVTKIGEYAFSYCSSLKEFVVPSGVQVISRGMLAYCTTLESIVIPEGITMIQDQAFAGCLGLVRIEFKGNAPDFGESTFSGVLAFALYPKADKSWSEGKMQEYGGSLIWNAQNNGIVQSEVSGPEIPQSADQAWQGSYVYFGEYQLKEVTSDILLDILRNTEFDEDKRAVVDGITYCKYDYQYYESIPVRWQVLSANDKVMLLLSESILDAHAFDEGSNGDEIKWATSELRNWLAEDFYNVCFDENEQTAIVETTLSNATGGELDGGPMTTDKVFLLSAQEMTNTNYGFWGTSAESPSRMAKVLPGVRNKFTTWTAGFTDKYIYNSDTETAYYWTRTPYNLRYGFALNPKFVSANGQVGYGTSVMQTWRVGIRPAVRISKNSDQWSTEIETKALYLSAEYLELKEGETKALSALVMPSEYAPTDVIWKSSAPAVATVDQEGNITAVAEGTVVIKVITANGLMRTCTVVVGNDKMAGDINGDGNVNLNDMMMCLNYVSGSGSLEEEALQRADVNGDGIVDLTDVMRLLNYTSGASGEV